MPFHNTTKTKADNFPGLGICCYYLMIFAPKLKNINSIRDEEDHRNYCTID